jgi:hypothetical protein
MRPLGVYGATIADLILLWVCCPQVWVISRENMTAPQALCSSFNMPLNFRKECPIRILTPGAARAELMEKFSDVICHLNPRAGSIERGYVFCRLNAYNAYHLVFEVRP